MQPVLRARNVTKRWGTTLALDDVTVDVPRGVTGLLGANGAGKTTLLGLVLGFHAPDSGALEVLGGDPAAAGPEVRARIGYAPEHDSLPPDVQAQDLVRHVCELHGIPRRSAMTRASDALYLVGLGEERFRPVGTMSTGQTQRVKIAQAIAHDPRLILLDEPTNGLDPLQRDDMLMLVRRIGHELDIDVVVSSHLMDEVEQVCDAVVVLDAGRLSASVDVAGLRVGGSTLLVEVDGDAEPLVRALSAVRLEATVTGPGRLTVEVADPAALDLVRDAMDDAGIGLRRLQPRTASLQELFFADGEGPV